MKWGIILQYKTGKDEWDSQFDLVNAGAYDEVLRIARNMVKEAVDRVDRVFIVKSPSEERVEDWYKDFEKWEEQEYEETMRKIELEQLERLQKKYPNVRSV